MSSEVVLSEKMQLNPLEIEVIYNSSLLIDAESVDIPRVVYGRLMSGKSINKGGLKNLFESLWQNKAGVQIEDLNEGIITLTFGSEAIKNRILKGQPWQFANSYLILVEANAMSQITVELFQHIPFWVQVHRIPLGFLAKPFGERLAEEISNSMGQFLEFDPSYRSSFMRMRVNLNSSRPLLRGKILKLDSKKESIWVSFRYERLSKFCFFCGHLDHIQKDCAALMEEHENGNMPVIQNDVSLKTPGLGNTIPLKAGSDRSVNKRSMGEITLEASRKNSKNAILEQNAKRLKGGITSSMSTIESVSGESIVKEKEIQDANKQMNENGEADNATYATKRVGKGRGTSTLDARNQSRNPMDSSAC